MAGNDYRNESRRRPPDNRWATPGTRYPTANPYDIVITEEVPIREGNYEPALYGTPHGVVAAALLCHQEQPRGNNTDKAPVRVYANPRLAQETYNLVHGDSEENDQAYPVFVRNYLLPRGYTKGTIGDPLGALIGFTITSGGHGFAATNPSPGYGKSLEITFSGGGGSGATAFAEVVAGVIVAVVLTNSGTGYTSAPTVIVSGLAGGSGDVIAALIQPQTALLVDETETPAEEPYAGYFVRVTRTWKTIPGPLISTTRLDDDGVTVTTSRQLKKISDITTSEAVTTGVWTRKWKGQGDAFYAEQITETRAIPGNAITTTKYDAESDTLYTEVKTRKELTAITEGPTTPSGGSPHEVITESEPITAIVGWEIIKTFPTATAHDLASALPISEDSLPFQFPATLNIVEWVLSSGVVGYAKGFVRPAAHLKKVFFVVSATKPVLGDYITPLEPGALFNFLLNGDPIGEVIYDGALLHFPGVDVTFPGSNPTLTDYLADWVGVSTPLQGNIKQSHSKYRWRVEITFVVLLEPELPTYS